MATTLRLVDPEQPQEHLDPTEVDLDEGNHGITFENGVARIEHGDGSVTFDENPDRSGGDEPDEDDFYRNLAGAIDDEELGRIASDLLTGIELDKQSRK